MAKQTTSTPSDKTTGAREGRSTRRLGGGATSGARPVRPAAETSSRSGGPSLLTFAQESRSELRKVTWPTRQEAMNLTFAVVAMTVGIAVFLGLVDGILDALAKAFIG